MVAAWGGFYDCFNPKKDETYTYSIQIRMTNIHNSCTKTNPAIASAGLAHTAFAPFRNCGKLAPFRHSWKRAPKLRSLLWAATTPLSLYVKL